MAVAVISKSAVLLSRATAPPSPLAVLPSNTLDVIVALSPA